MATKKQRKTVGLAVIIIFRKWHATQNKRDKWRYKNRMGYQEPAVMPIEIRIAALLKGLAI